MLLQPQRRVEEAVCLCVHSGQRVSVFCEPQQSAGTNRTKGGIRVLLNTASEDKIAESALCSAVPDGFSSALQGFVKLQTLVRRHSPVSAPQHQQHWSLDLQTKAGINMLYRHKRGSLRVEEYVGASDMTIKRLHLRSVHV